MIASTTEGQLRQLREGDRLSYHGVQWRVADYSTYTDANGYETEEWLLNSQTGQEYYLMRELDPNNPEGVVHWYIAEELHHPTLYDGSSLREVTYTVADEMRSHKTPYPALQVFNRTYQFESQTEGIYETDGENRTRITWDYWDAPHLWNLALEAWSSGELSVYSTREVQPADFTDFKSGSASSFGGYRSALTGQDNRAFGSADSSNGFNQPSPHTIQIAIAWVITILGFILMISGI